MNLSDLFHGVRAAFLALPPFLRLCLLVSVGFLFIRSFLSWHTIEWRRNARYRKRRRRQNLKTILRSRAEQGTVQESAIEESFRLVWRRMYPGVPLIAQYQVCQYHVDFAYVPAKIAIELDGFQGHSSPLQIEKDRKRQRAIENLGWRFVRFGGREVHRNPEQCVRETYAFIVRSQQGGLR